MQPSGQNYRSIPNHTYTPPGPTPPMSSAPAPAYHPGGLQALTDKISDYIEKVALPGVYNFLL